ncbi:MAG: hypothetical protein ACLFR1_11395 [Spirochaetia bacterium]
MYQSDEHEDLYLYEVEDYPSQGCYEQEEYFRVEPEKSLHERLVKILSDMDY